MTCDRQVQPVMNILLEAIAGTGESLDGAQVCVTLNREPYLGPALISRGPSPLGNNPGGLLLS